MRLALGLVLGLASTIGLNWSFFAQHQASNDLPPLSLAHPFRSLRSLFTNGRWLLGYAVGMGGWGLYIVALFFAPISLVQAVSAGGVGTLALLVWRVAHIPLARRDVVAVGLCLAGLALLCVSFATGVPRPHAPGTTGLSLWVACTAAAAGLFWLVGSRVLRSGAGLGAAAGLMYAAGDVSTKAAAETSKYFVVVLVACHVLGFVFLQLAFQRGSALATAGLCTLLNNSIPIIAGVLAFNERLPLGAYGIVRLCAFALVVIGASLLARPEPTNVPGAEAAEATSHHRAPSAAS